MDRIRIKSLIRVLLLTTTLTAGRGGVAKAVTGQGIWIAFPNGTTCANYNTSPINDQTLCYDSVTGWQAFTGSAWKSPLLGGIPCSQMPALTGDTTSTAGTCTTTTSKTGGVAFGPFATQAAPCTLAQGCTGVTSAVGVPIELNKACSGNPNVDVLNTTVTTNIYNFSVPGNTMGATGVLHLRLIGDLLVNTAGTKTDQYVINWGGATFISGPTNTNGNSANRNTEYIDVYIHNTGTTNSQYGYAIGIQNAGVASGSSGNIASGFQHSGYATAAIDTTAASVLNVTMTLGTSTATIEYRMMCAILTLE